MESEFLVRVLVVGLITALALAFAAFSRQGRAGLRRPHAPGGLPVGLTLFTSITCSTCAEFKSRLKAMGADFSEVSYEDQPERFSEHDVKDVPMIVMVLPDGTRWRVSGVPSSRRLRRWLVLDHRWSNT